MSAYLVEKEHILFLVEAARQLPARRIQGYWFCYYHDDCSRYMTEDYRLETDPDHAVSPATVGTILWRENARSIKARYPDTPDSELEACTVSDRDTRRTAAEIDPVEVLKAIACLDYQSCETDDWEQTEAHAILAVLRDIATSLVPGYADAPWGYPSDWRTRRPKGAAKPRQAQPPRQRQANARLIAAAPEMLRALEGAESLCLNWANACGNVVAERRGIGLEATETLRYNLALFATDLRALIDRAGGE